MTGLRQKITIGIVICSIGTLIMIGWGIDLIQKQDQIYRLNFIATKFKTPNPEMINKTLYFQESERAFLYDNYWVSIHFYESKWSISLGEKAKDGSFDGFYRVVTDIKRTTNMTFNRMGYTESIFFSTSEPFFDVYIMEKRNSNAI
jgi:hypothetical protein